MEPRMAFQLWKTKAIKNEYRQNLGWHLNEGK